MTACVRAFEPVMNEGYEQWGRNDQLKEELLDTVSIFGCNIKAQTFPPSCRDWRQTRTQFESLLFLQQPPHERRNRKSSDVTPFTGETIKPTSPPRKRLESPPVSQNLSAHNLCCDSASAANMVLIGFCVRRSFCRVILRLCVCFMSPSGRWAPG